MSIESVVGKIIIIALVGIGLYTFFALVDLIRTKGSKQMRYKKIDDLIVFENGKIYKEMKNHLWLKTVNS